MCHDAEPAVDDEEAAGFVSDPITATAVPEDSVVVCVLFNVVSDGAKSWIIMLDAAVVLDVVVGELVIIVSVVGTWHITSAHMHLLTQIVEDVFCSTQRINKPTHLNNLRDSSNRHQLERH